MPSETLDHTPNPLLQMLSEEERKGYTVQSPYPQSYCYPTAIILYVARNPASLNEHYNFIQSAKALFRLSRIIPVKKVESCADDGNKMMVDGHIFNLADKSFEMWITSELWIRTQINPYFASTLSKRIYRCTPAILVLLYQILTFEQLKGLGSGDDLKSVSFTENIIRNDVDGSIVEFENVFEVLLKSRFADIKLPSEQHGIGKNTARKMVEFFENSKIARTISIRKIPENFQFATFGCFLKANLIGNQYIKHGIQLTFSDTISQEYKDQLQTFVYDIIAIVEHDRSLEGKGVPLITFVGHDEQAFNKLFRMKKLPPMARKTVR